MMAMLSSPLEKLAPKDFKRRFAAWWEGDEYTPPEPTDSDVPDGQEQAETRQEEGPVPNVPELMLAMAIAQGLWGDGYLGPGSQERYEELIKTLSLSHDKSMAIIGAGLAGPARDITRASEVWITGYEPRAVAIPEAERQCTMAGLSKKVTMTPCDLETIEFPEAKFHAVASFEELLFVKDKARLIKQVELSLKPSGMLLFTDFVSLADEVPTERLEQLFGSLWGEPELWSAGQYAQSIAETGLGIRVNEDMTQDYLPLIEESCSRWSKILEDLKSDESSAAFQAMVTRAIGEQEAQWLQRLDALQKKEMALYRFLALKPTAPVQ